MRVINKILAIVFLTLVGLFYWSAAQAQTESKDSFSLLQILPAITFILALVTGVLNLYIMNKLGKTKEEILTLVRAEFKSELADFERRMATKEQIDFMRREFTLMLNNIETKIDSSASRDKRNDDESRHH